MIEGQIILQEVSASFGQLETPSRNGDPVFATTFTDPASGLSVSVLWAGGEFRDFFAKAVEAIGGVIPVPAPKLEIVRTLPGDARGIPR